MPFSLDRRRGLRGELGRAAIFLGCYWMRVLVKVKNAAGPGRAYAAVLVSALAGVGVSG